jgi:hypothetical protein
VAEAAAGAPVVGAAALEDVLLGLGVEVGAGAVVGSPLRGGGGGGGGGSDSGAADGGSLAEAAAGSGSVGGGSRPHTRPKLRLRLLAAEVKAMLDEVEATHWSQVPQQHAALIRSRYSAAFMGLEDGAGRGSV